MMKPILLFICLFLAMPLVVAVSLDVSSVNLQPGESTTFTVTGCTDESIVFVRVFSPGEDSNLINVFQGSIGSEGYVLNYPVVADTGRYQARATCQGDSGVATKEFCVGITCQAPPPVVQAPSPSRSRGGGGGDGSRVISKTTPVVVCVPSWTCREWSSCTNGKQTRSCLDEKVCNTENRKPIIERSCTVPDALVISQNADEGVDAFGQGKSSSFQQLGSSKASDGGVSSVSTDSQSPSLVLILVWVLAGLILVVSIVVGIIVFVRSRKNNVPEEVSFNPAEQKSNI